MAENQQDRSTVTEADDDVVPMTDEITFQTNKLVDLAVTVAVFALGAFIVSEATTFRRGSFPDPITARGLPYFTGGFMMLAAIIIGARQVLSWRRFPGAYTLTVGAEDEPGQEASAARAFGMIAVSLCLVVLLRPVGFLIAAPVAIFAMLWLMQVRSPGKLVGFPLGFTATIWIAFSQVLGVVLPLGPLTAIARSWGLTP